MEDSEYSLVIEPEDQQTISTIQKIRERFDKEEKSTHELPHIKIIQPFSITKKNIQKLRVYLSHIPSFEITLSTIKSTTIQITKRKNGEEYKSELLVLYFELNDTNDVNIWNVLNEMIYDINPKLRNNDNDDNNNNLHPEISLNQSTDKFKLRIAAFSDINEGMKKKKSLQKLMTKKICIHINKFIIYRKMKDSLKFQKFREIVLSSPRLLANNHSLIKNLLHHHHHHHHHYNENNAINFEKKIKNLISNPTFRYENNEWKAISINSEIDCNHHHNNNDNDNLEMKKQNYFSNLKIISFNILFNIQENKYWKFRYEKLFELISIHDADILCFQEVTLDFLELLQQNKFIQKNYYLSDISMNSKTITTYGQLTLSKFYFTTYYSFLNTTKIALFSHFQFHFPIIINNNQYDNNHNINQNNDNDHHNNDGDDDDCEEDDKKAKNSECQIRNLFLSNIHLTSDYRSFEFYKRNTQIEKIHSILSQMKILSTPPFYSPSSSSPSSSSSFNSKYENEQRIRSNVINDCFIIGDSNFGDQFQLSHIPTTYRDAWIEYFEDHNHHHHHDIHNNRNGYTFNTDTNQLARENSNSMEKRRLDRIFYDSFFWRCNDIQIIATETYPIPDHYLSNHPNNDVIDANDRSICISDHYALLAHFHFDHLPPLSPSFIHSITPHSTFHISSQQMRQNGDDDDDDNNNNDNDDIDDNKNLNIIIKKFGDHDNDEDDFDFKNKFMEVDDRFIDDYLDFKLTNANFLISNQTIDHQNQVFQELKNLLRSTIFKENFQTNWTLMPLGSKSLDLQSNTSDFDCILLSPISRLLIFPYLLYQILKQNNAKKMKVVHDGKCPLISFELNGVHFDMLYARLPKDYNLPVIDQNNNNNQTSTFNPLSLSKSQIQLMNAKDSLPSFNGLYDSHLIQSQVKQFPNFKTFFLLIKYWAKQRKIYNGKLGYFNGISLMFLTLKICIDYPDLQSSISSLIFKFFSVFSKWEWNTNAIVLFQNNHHFVKEKGNNRDLMIILTPSIPPINVLRYVTFGTKKIIINELERADHLLSSQFHNLLSWYSLFQSKESIPRTLSSSIINTNSFHSLNQKSNDQKPKMNIQRNDDDNAKNENFHFIKIKSESNSADVLRELIGFVESKISHFIKKLENNAIIAYPVCSQFVPLNHHQKSVILLIATPTINVEKSSPFIIHQLNDIFLNSKKLNPNIQIIEFDFLSYHELKNEFQNLQLKPGNIDDIDDDDNNEMYREIEMNEKSKKNIKSAIEVYNEIKKGGYNLMDFLIYYEDRFAGIIMTRFDRYDIEKIPIHRVVSFKYKDQLLWDKSLKLDFLN